MIFVLIGKISKETEEELNHELPANRQYFKGYKQIKAAKQRDKLRNKNMTVMIFRYFQIYIPYAYSDTKHI